MARRVGLLVALLVVGPALGLGAFRIASGYERDRARARFDDFFSGRTSSLERELSVIGEVLHATRSLFESSVEVTREEFSTFTRPLLERHPFTARQK